MTVIRVVDFETTGTEPPAEVCEVGYSDFDLSLMEVYDPQAWLCAVKAMPPEVRAVHHITLADCEPYNPFDPSLIADNHVNAYAAHNADFEMKFWAPQGPMICTYKAALRIWPSAPSHSNQGLRYWLADQGLLSLDHETAMPPHRAGPDAYVTAHILKALFASGATGKDMVAWTKEPKLLPTCPIGKFRGKPWAEVEGGFLGWMLRQPDMDPDLKWNADREINRRAKGAN